jgi:hypothetical protein
MSAQVERIEKLARLLLEQKAQVDAAATVLAAAKAEALRTETQDLPELMHELGLSEVKLEDGTTVRVADEVECSITEANRFAAHAWLRQNGFGGLIKTSVAFQVPRECGAQEMAETILEDLHEHEIETTADLVERVHPATLKAFVKEQLAEGRSVPENLFSIFPYSKAKIALPKK